MNFLKNPRSLIFIILQFGISQAYGQAQTPNYSLIDNLNPVTPTAWQFTKYDQLPVSEYTGVPNVSIPLYEIDEDGVKIPLDLTYHGGGIRVNEEASWVGLGWDMTVGSIVQQINDQDDYAVTSHVEPDYYNSGAPNVFPYKYTYCALTFTCSYGCSGLIPVNPVIAADGLEIYTQQYAPFGGDYGYMKPQNYMHFFDDHFGNSLDSEPDIFTANFLGHSFKFIRDISSGQIVVLNKKGYKVTKTGNLWTVIVPSGEEYDFAEECVVKSQTVSYGIAGSESESVLLPSSNVWMLTKIITKNKKVITLNYSQTARQACYPTVTQRGITATLTSTYSSANPTDWTSFCGSSDVNAGGPSSGTYDNISSSSEPYTYLSSITFPKGSVSFNLSSRNDISGGMKLDGFSVSTTQQVKSYAFSYGYFDATGVGGNSYNFGSSYGTYPDYRLKLLSIADNSGATYTFTYNSTQLPVKNSFAVDYWGYYNGALTNKTFVPNATQFNKTGWLANTDNHSANLTYLQAGMLQQIQYPTGGTVNFAYEMNKFNNYWVPDYSGSTNTLSSGDGLRIQSITWKDASGSQLKRTNYSYSTGIASLALNFFRGYNYATTPPGTMVYGQSQGVMQKVYQVNETNMSGCYTSNPFASFNGVGYSQVTETEVDASGVTNGKTVSNYFNHPDQVYNTITQAQQTDPTLPAYKDPVDTAENGSLKSQYVYDKSNNLLKKLNNSYSKVVSNIYYGARLMGYASLVRYQQDSQISNNYDQILYPQSMVCYYPIYDFETLLSGSKETDYFGADSLSVTTNKSYDQYNQLSVTQSDNSDGTTTYEYLDYPYSYSPAPGTVFYDMTNANRLSDVVGESQTKSIPTGSPIGINSFSRYYKESGGLFEVAKDLSYRNSGAAGPADSITYDKYDAVGNIQQYSSNTLPTSVLWDYKNEYVIAEARNAALADIAYTSFEADGTGRWKFTGSPSPDNNAPTGERVYSLANGSIYRDSLSTAKTYIVSYWSKNGAQTVSGSSATKTGYTFNGYTYYEHTVVNPASGTITVSGTGTIDELRLYPNITQMTTYTYAPLVGITSESNPAGKISYYEYDGSMRLLDIRDQNKNILKAFCYNLAGQSTMCGLDITYSNQLASQAFTRNNCGSGYMSVPVTYTVPSGKYTSTMSLLDANNQAAFDITTNGQAYANANGTCFIPPTITGISYLGHANLVQVSFGTVPGCTTAIIHYTDTDTNTPYSQVGGCSSPQNITIPVSQHHYSFTVTFYPSNYTTPAYNYFANF